MTSSSSYRIGRRTFLVAAAGTPLAAPAQSWPSKPVRMIVPGNPGAPADALVRALSDELASRLGQPLVIENKAGAQGSIGLGLLAKSEPDGHTIGLINLQNVAVASLRTRLPYDLYKSFVPVARLSFENPVLIVGPKAPVASVAQLIKYLKANAGRVSYATPGSGTPSHLGMELLTRELGVKLLHIPYKGAVAAATDVAGGQADLTLVGAAAAMNLVKSGRVKALAVSSDRRLVSLPDVPTFAETEFGKLDVRGWVGVVAPAGTPGAIVGRIQGMLVSALEVPLVRERLATLGSSPAPLSSSEFASFIRREDARWSKVVKDAKITFD